MGKPSMFSNNYHQQVKRRKLNKFLFLLLLLCIGIFGGKYYLNQHNIYPIKNISKTNIIKNIKISKLWDWTKRKPQKVEASKPSKSSTDIVTKPVVTSQAIVPAAKPQNITESYIYTDSKNNKYKLTYQKDEKGLTFSSFTEPSNTSEYCISKDKKLLVFDIKSSSSLILCDSTGKFVDITRPFYKTKSTRKIIPKETAMGSHKGYIWAEKPYFTQDNRVVYISRLPFIRSDETLYLWSENLDGTNYKNLYRLGSDKTQLSYGGYDDKGRLIVKLKGSNYFLDKSSFMLRRQ